MLFPTAGLQFSEGIALAKKLFGTDNDSIVLEGAGTCTDVEEIQKVANKLLLQERVDVIVGYVGHAVYDSLAELCNEYKKILILADMGGVVAYKALKSPYTFIHSFNEWAATYNLGKKLADRQHVISAMSLMEAGYSLGYSFVKGLEANGSDVKGFFMSKLDIEQEYLDRLANVVTEENPDLVYCGYTGKDAQVFFEGMGDALSNTQLVGSGWLTLPGVLAKYGSSMNGTLTASAYYTTLNNEANKKFLKEFEEQTENEGDSFALLGYEVGMMLFKAAVHNDSGKLLCKKTAEALEALEIDSPRGTVAYHPTEHYTIAGCWFAEVKQDNGKYYNEITDNISKVDMEVWRADEANWPNGGWYNPYPCT